MNSEVNWRHIQALSNWIFSDYSTEYLSHSLVEEISKSLPVEYGFHSWIAQAYINNEIPFDHWPNEVAKAYAHNQWHTGSLLSESILLSESLNRYSIEHTFLKGIWMAQEVLPDTKLRYFDDVDLWISPRNYKLIDEVMSENEFTKVDYFHHYFHFHKTFKKNLSHTSVYIEVHKALSLDDFYKFDHQKVWQDAHRESNTALIQLKPAHQLVYFFCHNSLHSFDRLSRFMDLPAVYNWAYKKGFEFSEILEITSKWNCRRLFLYSLVALETLLNQDLGSSHFDGKDVLAAKEQFGLWFHAFINNANSSHSRRRYSLSDTKARALYGFVHPRRIMGSLIDRLGIY